MVGLIHAVEMYHINSNSMNGPISVAEFCKGGFQYAIKAHVAHMLGGSGGRPPGKIDLLRLFVVYC